jgi:hypothetical protein
MDKPIGLTIAERSGCRRREVRAVKSNKQRRAELRARREARLLLAAQKAGLYDRRHGVPVDPDQLAPNDTHCNSRPDFVVRGYYVDQPFECRACGEPQVWTAAQQKWWYEVAKGDVWTKARFCRPCRRRERSRREEARRVHLEGLARKARGQAGPDAEARPGG